MAEPRPGRTRWLLAAVGPVLLVAHTVAWSRTVDLAGLDAWRRLWSDLAVAISMWVDSAHGPAAPEAVVARDEAADRFARDAVLRRIEREQRRPDRPLSTIAERPFVVDRIAPATRPYDDKGRAVLLGLAFRLRGGIAPFLILWMGAVLAVPIVAWAGVELVAAGRGLAAALFGAFVGLSAYVVETLGLGRYPVAFYLGAVLLIVPLAVYASLHPRPTLSGLAVRLAAAAALFTLCVFGRSSAALLGPGFLLAAAPGLRRTLGGGARWWAALAVVAVVFALPSRLVSGAQQNDIWQPVWEGLGDFDREKGYTWSDEAAEAAARRAGAPGLWTPASEDVFRRQVLGDVGNDPGWFTGILVRRLAATVSLWKLWPQRAWSGAFLRTRTSPNEGVIDKYWTYTATADQVGWGPVRVEVPALVLLVPAIVLAALAMRGRPGARAMLMVVAAPFAATLVLPVLITTAGGQEAQAIAVAYLLAGALVVDLAGEWWRARRGRAP